MQPSFPQFSFSAYLIIMNFGPGGFKKHNSPFIFAVITLSSNLFTYSIQMEIECRLPLWLYDLNTNLQEENTISIWIIQYYYMLSTTQTVAAFYGNIISNPELLANGYNIIKEYLFASQQNRKNTIVSILHPQVPILTLISNIYPLEIFNSQHVSAEEKIETLQFLINLVTSETIKTGEFFSKKMVCQLFNFLHKIHNIEGFNEAVVLFYEKSLEMLVENQTSKLGFFLLNLLKEADDRVNTFTRHIIGLIVGSEWIPDPEQQLQVLYYCFKSLAILNDTDPDVIQEYVQAHITPTIQYIMTNMKRSIRTMKYSLKIFTLLFGDYQIDIKSEITRQIQSITTAIIIQYVNYLNRGSIDSGGDMDINQNEEDSDPIQIALYQLLQLYMTLYSSDVKVNNDLVLYLCIVSSFLGEGHYRDYLKRSDQYLMEIENEGDTNIRNKSIYFIGTLLELKDYEKRSKKILSEYINQVIINPAQITNRMVNFLGKYKLPSLVLRIPEIYTESALFILYSQAQVAQNKKQLCVSLANHVKISSPEAIDVILSTLVLSRLIKEQSEVEKKYYLGFLRELVAKFINNTGMLIVISKGLYTYTPIEQLVINESLTQNISLHLVNALINYIMRNDSAQSETGYIILQFFVHLCKNQSNKPILSSLLTHEHQFYLLKTFLHDGMASSVLTDLVVNLGNPTIIQTIFKQIESGYANDQTLSNLISKCMRSGILALNEQQISRLCAVYAKKIDIIIEIVTVFLQTQPLTNQPLISFLNQNLNRKWIPGLLKQNRIINLYDIFMRSVIKITKEITSQHQLQCELIVPYTILLNNITETVNVLIQQGIFEQFFTKLYDYARLFKGNHLRIVTGHVFIGLASLRKEMIPKVIELIENYGKIESDEWEEEVDENEIEEKIMTQLFMNITNEQVEESFKSIFGELAWESNILLSKLNALKSLT